MKRTESDLPYRLRERAQMIKDGQWAYEPVLALLKEAAEAIEQGEARIKINAADQAQPETTE